MSKTITDWETSFADDVATLSHHEAGGWSRAPLYHESAHSTAHDLFGTRDAFPFVRMGGKNWMIAQSITPHRKGHSADDILTSLNGGVNMLVLDMRDSEVSPSDIASLLTQVDFNATPLGLQGDIDDMLLLRDLYQQHDMPQNAHAACYYDPINRALLASRPLSDNFNIATSYAAFDDSPNISLMHASDEAWHMNSHGRDPISALGFVAASFIAYARALETCDMPLRTAFEKITIGIDLGSDFFVNIAKIRAARYLAAQIMNAAGIDDLAPQIHARVSTHTHALSDAALNIVRATTAALAAGIAGVDVLTIPPFSALSNKDSEQALRTARNTQNIIQAESHITRSIDPSGGSWYIDNLTKEFAQKAWELMQKIEAQGGMVKAIESDFMRDYIAHQQNTITPPDMVGVNLFASTAEAILPPASPASPHFCMTRPAAPYETLRHAAQKSRPQVYLACLGTEADFTARAQFAETLYAAAGIKAITGIGGNDLENIVNEFKAQGVYLTVICGNDASYDAHAAKLAIGLRAAGAKHIGLVGSPRPLPEANGFCIENSTHDNAYAYLCAVHDALGLKRTQNE